MDEETNKPVMIHDLSVGKFDLIVKAGPSYSTQRQEAVEAMGEMLNANPELWQVIGDLVAKNMDWPGADEFAKRLKKMVDPAILDEEPEEGDEAPPPPTPEEIDAVVQQGVEERLASEENQAKLAKAEADKAGAAADMAEAEAKMAEVMQGMNGMDEEQMKDFFADMMAEFIQNQQQTPQSQ